MDVKGIYKRKVDRMNWKQIIRCTITYLFCGITIIQTIMGIIWMGSQFSHVQMYQSTLEHLDAANSFLLDEYMGILYPIILWIFTCAEHLFGIPYQIGVYIIQLGLALLAIYRFSDSTSGLTDSRKSIRVLTCCYMMSVPMLLQMHMSILPNSLSFSFLLLFADSLLRGLKTEKSNMVQLFFSITGAGLCMPDNLWIMGIVLLVYGGYLFIKNKTNIVGKKIFLQIAVVLGSFLLTMLCLFCTQETGSRGRIQKSFWAAMFQRTVSEYFSQSFMVWDVRVQQTFTLNEFMENANRSDNMMYVVGPRLEEKWGKDTANELYRSMTLDCVRLRTKQVAYRIKDDFVDAITLPFSFVWQKNINRQSGSGIVYDAFREYNKLAQNYMMFSINGCTLLLAVRVLEVLVFRNENKKRKRKQGMLLLSLTAIMQMVFVIMGSGVLFHYLQLPLVIFIWYFAAQNRKLSL